MMVNEVKIKKKTLVYNVFEFLDDSEFMSAQSDTATRNSVIIRLKGHVEVMLTPLLLEGLQR